MIVSTSTPTLWSTILHVVFGPPFRGKHTQVPKSFTNLKRLKLGTYSKHPKRDESIWDLGRFTRMPTDKGYANSTLRQTSFLTISKWVNMNIDDMYILYTHAYSHVYLCTHIVQWFLSKLLINFTVTAPENHCKRIPQLSSTYNLGYSPAQSQWRMKVFFSRSPH